MNGPKSQTDSGSDIGSSTSDSGEPDSAETIDRIYIPETEGKHPRKIGSYLLCKEIGRGGMGVVYEATDLRLKRQVALKELPAGSRLDRSRVKRFQNESLAAAQLNHPNIVPVYEAEEENGVYYFTMRLIEGRNLSQIIKSIQRELARSVSAKVEEKATHATCDVTAVATPTIGPSHLGQPSDKSLTPDYLSLELSASGFSRRSGRVVSTARIAKSVARVGSYVADALQHAHEVGVIHRDIKPSNLMLDNHGKIWVADFGLAHIMGSPSLTRHGVAIGTTRYMSPEQAAGMHGMVDHRTDIYSLGVTLCELLLLQPLFKGNSEQEIIRQIIYGAPPKIRQIDPGVPEDLSVILEKAMSRDPLERYTTAREMANDLNRFLRHESIHAKRPNLLKRGKHWIHRHKQVAVSFAIAAAAILVVSTCAAIFFGRQSHIYLLALKRSEGYRALLESEKLRDTNPGLSQRLAEMAFQLLPNVESKLSLQRAQDVNHEYAAVVPRDVVSSFVAISPLGDTAVTCASSTINAGEKSFPATIHRIRDGAIQRTLDNGEHIIAAAYSHSGRYILTSSKPKAPSSNSLDSPPTVWDSSTEKMRRIEKAGLDRPNAGTIHPSLDRAVLLAESDAVVYDLANGTELLTIRGHTDTIFYAEYSPDGKRILTISNDSTIRIWDSESGREIRPSISWATKDRRAARATFVSTSDAVIVTEGYSVRRISLEPDADAIQATSSLVSVDIYVSRAHEQFVSYEETTKLVVRSSRDLQQICELQIPADFRAPNGSRHLMAIASVRLHPKEKKAVVISENRAFLFDTSSGQLLAQFLGHQFPITDCSTSGDLITTLSNDKSLKLWRADSGLLQRTFQAHYVEPNSSRDCQFALSSNDKLLAIANSLIYKTTRRSSNGDVLAGTVNGALSLGQVRNRDRLLTVDGKTAIITELSTSRELYRGSFDAALYFESQLVSNGQRFIAHTMDTKAWLVDVKTESRLPLGSNGDRINGVYVSKDASLVLLTYDNGNFEAVDATSGQQKWSRQHTHRILSADFSNDDRLLSFVDSAGNLEIWNIETWDQEFNTVVVDLVVEEIKFVGEATVVVWNATQDSNVRCYSLDSPEKFTTLSVNGPIAIDAHPTKPLALIGSADGVIIWNTVDDKRQKIVSERRCRSVCATNDRIGVLLDGTESRPGEFAVFDLEGAPLKNELLELFPLRILADRKHDEFVFSMSGFTAEVFDFQSGELAFVTDAGRSKLSWVGFSGDSTMLFTVAEEGLISVFDHTGKPLSSEDVSDSKAMIVAQDGQSGMLIIGCESGELIQWSTREFKQISKSTDHQRPILAMSVSGSSGRAITAALGEPARYWNLSTFESVEVALPSAVQVDIDASGNSSLLIVKTGPNTHEARMVDHRQLKTIPLYEKKAVRSVKFSPDGSRYGLLTSRGTVEIFDRTSSKKERTITLAMERIKDFKFDGNGNLVVAHGSSCSLWSIDRNQAVLQMDCKIEVSPKARPTILFSYDGQWVVAHDSQDGRVRKWPRDPSRFAQIGDVRKFTEQESQQFRFDLPLIGIPRDNK